MEDNIKKRIYFIFSQDGTENNPYQLEKSKQIDNIQVINQEKQLIILILYIQFQ